MNFTYLASTILAALLLLAAKITTAESRAIVNSGGVASRATAVGQDVIRNFQLGNYSYELVRFSEYDLYYACLGHRASHAESVMDNIERVCGAVANLSYPAQKPARMLLRESNYFDCGRDQLKVDLIDCMDAGQRCVVQFINPNGMKWVNGAQAGGIRWLALLWPLMVAGAFILL
jgi:hypothetical protein